MTGLDTPPSSSPAPEFEFEPYPDTEVRFWRKYNEHYEFPIGVAISLLAVVMIVAMLVFGFLRLMNMGKDSKPVSIMAIGGDDDFGVGSMGGGGEENPLQMGEPTPADFLRDELPQDLNQVKEDLSDRLKLDDPTQDIPIPDHVAAAFGALDRDLQDKLMGSKKGQGPGTGTGDDPSGSGIGGTGSDSTRARGMRWVLRFNTRSGVDYLNQLKALKAIVMIPVPPDNKRMIIIRDPGSPRIDEYASDSDIAAQANKIQFQDVRRASNEAIAEALRLPRVPSAFWAFFPKDLEAQMSVLETSYQNKKSDDIKETVFQVIVSGGEARLRVVSQRLK